MNAATLLIVDDEDLIRWSLRERFTQDGHTVIEAATKAEALLRINPAIDLVLLDVRLPDGSGLDVMRRIKDVAPDTPVILMTAFSSVENAVEAVKLGAHNYVQKPFDIEDVVVAVDKALETSHLRREVRTLRSSEEREYETFAGPLPRLAAADA